jgi:hypothetical protein
MSCHGAGSGSGSGSGVSVEAVVKRWTRARGPTQLLDFGFEDMESQGAVYSRVASHTFGDWNACGKVMGLAPWADSLAAPMPPPLFAGDLMHTPMRVSWDVLDRLPWPNE